jgi:hypothetical protein
MKKQMVVAVILLLLIPVVWMLEGGPVQPD